MILGKGSPYYGACFEELDHAVTQLQIATADERAVDFNAHNFPPHPGHVVFNLENYDRLRDPLAWAPHEIWDFSSSNVSRYPGAMDVTHVPLGYHPTMRRFDMRPFKERDIDVVFFGAAHPRREKLFATLRSFNLHVVTHSKYVPASVRDALLARSKIALNLRFYEDGLYPTLRTMHLVANGVPVVSETAPEMPGWAKLAHHVPYDKLAAMVVSLLKTRRPIDDTRIRRAFEATPLALPKPKTKTASLHAVGATAGRLKNLDVSDRPPLASPKKIVVAVLVFDRLANVTTWIHCWRQARAADAELVIVHNFTGDGRALDEAARARRDACKALCLAEGITYVPRAAGGLDIGAFQDVCRGRLAGFPDYDGLLWCTDDCLPMQKNFLETFRRALSPHVGVACMTLSNEWARHIRTTGFLLRRETAEKLRFAADPIQSKDDCYDFEHRGGPRSFYEQVRAMGLQSAQVAPVETSPLWDSDYSRRLPRRVEHERVFGRAHPEKPFASKKKVLVICTIFDGFPTIVPSLLAQTHDAWELVLLDDNPDDIGTEGLVCSQLADSRVTYIRRPHVGQHGHPHRQWALNEAKAGRLGPQCDFVLVTNADNYYLPHALEKLVAGFARMPSAVAAYVATMLHTYGSPKVEDSEDAWNVVPCSPALGKIDCGGVLLRRDAACAVGWRSFEPSSDWTYFADVIATYGEDRWIKVPGALFVHN